VACAEFSAVAVGFVGGATGCVLTGGVTAVDVELLDGTSTTGAGGEAVDVAAGVLDSGGIAVAGGIPDASGQSILKVSTTPPEVVTDPGRVEPASGFCPVG